MPGCSGVLGSWQLHCPAGPAGNGLRVRNCGTSSAARDPAMSAVPVVVVHNDRVSSELFRVGRNV